MNQFDRRTFLKASAASRLTARAVPLFAAGARQVTAGETNGTVRIEGGWYVFEWSARDDRFRLSDKKNRLITSGVMQPVITVASGADVGTPRSASGKPAGHEVNDGQLTVKYEGVNGCVSFRACIWRYKIAATKKSWQVCASPPSRP
jgi:hypothetical protein